MMPTKIEDALREAKLQFEEGDVFVLLAANARNLAQRLMDLDADAFKKAYNDRVCSFKMGQPICEAEEASAFGIELYDSVDAVNDALLNFTVNIAAESKDFSLFCHKHNGHILLELS